MSTRFTVLRTNNAHRDYSKSSIAMTKQFNASDGFVLERGTDGSFRVSHPKAAIVLGVGPTEVLEWLEEAFMPGLAAAPSGPEKQSRSKVA